MWPHHQSLIGREHGCLKFIFIFSPLAHNPFPDPHEVCLVVKDLEKGTRPDHEPSKRHFLDLLKTKGVEGVSEVIPLRELKVEYKQYEAKTALCHRFDKFIVDDRILRLVPKFLGKPMFKRKRFPVPVKLGAGDLKAEIARAIRTAVLPLNHHGTCSMINVGNASMKSANVADNILGVAGALAKRYPGGWKNIRSILVKGENTTAVPVHINTSASNEVGFVDADIPKRVTRETVEDELSTQPGMTVKVTPFGHVKVTRHGDEGWDDEKDEPFVEGSEEEEEDEEEDGDDAKEQKKKVSKKGKKRRSDKGEEDEKAKKKKKVAAAETKEDSDQDEKLEEAELRYMQKVADEEEEMEEKEGEEKNAEEVSGESGGEDEEEDEDDEDDEGLDEEDVVRDDDDDDQDSSDADEDELIMKNRSQDSDEDDESE